MKISQPPEKIVKNLCTFLCQDVDETPAYSTAVQREKGVITVKSIISSDSGAANGKAAKANRQATNSEDSGKAKLSRRGAELAFQQLSREFGKDLFELVPKIWEFMAGGLLNAFTTGG